MYFFILTFANIDSILYYAVIYGLYINVYLNKVLLNPSNKTIVVLLCLYYFV